jgi:pilus assembly protein CpaC
VGGNVVITGSDLSPHAAAKVVAVQKIYPRVVNFSTVDPVAMQPMVLMDVQVMEFDRNALEELGIRWDTSISGPTGGLVKDFTTNDYYRVVPDQESQFQDLPLDLPGTQAFMGIATTIASRINLLVNKGKAYALASPQLSARSGGAAEFLAGGEVPIPLASAFGQTDVTFKEYGIRLHIEPVVNENNEVLASMMTEVSRIDPSVSVAGIPGFITRRAKSEVNVRSGETIVISGLTDLNAARSVDKFPFLGDIPILGRLFRSDNFRANRTELVIFITPRVVDPQSSENREVIDAGKAIRQGFEQTIGQDIIE